MNFHCLDAIYTQYKLVLNSANSHKNKFKNAEFEMARNKSELIAPNLLGLSFLSPWNKLPSIDRNNFALLHIYVF